MWVRVIVAIALLFLPTAVFAQAEKRIALLIGNKDYKAGVGSLTNPLNDIRIVGEALKSVGFEVLKPAQNVTRTAMLRAIHDFAAKLKTAGSDVVGFLYYSGHGVSSAGENYLIPIDVEEPSTVELSVQGVKQSEVLAILRGDAPNAAHYLILDACRNTLQGARGGKGFVPVGQQSGVLIAFATEPGKTASDLGQGSGPYAAALATELVKPEQSDLIMFHNVRVAVLEKTKGDQVPWTEDGIQRRQRVLFGGEAKAASPSSQATPPTIARLSEAGEAWGATKDSTNIAVLEAFIVRYKDTFYAELARARIDDLKKQQVASPPPKREQPTTVTGTLRCESYSVRSDCELDAFCSWADISKQCQRKSGSLATAMLDASPIAKAPSPSSCDGVEAFVSNENRCLKPKDSFKDCPDCPEMVVVPAGSFMMGSPDNEEKHENDEGPMHKVTIAKPFAVGKFEVTLDEWSACVAAGDCSYKANGVGKHPVSNVSWYDITKGFLPWLSRTARRTYRLLTEAEWEYAARAGTTTPFSTGGMITPEQANFDGREVYGGSGKGVYRARTVEVGTFRPNFFGLYDTHGNVSEWVEDCYKDSYTGAPSDGSAVIGDCASRVLRGGSSSGGPWVLRSAKRLASNPGIRSYNQGFRLARTLSQ
jgi:formylglycine-generating enzyme required for sulfatase activity